MADNSVFITGIAEGAFEEALNNLPGWATDATSDKIAGILQKTLNLQTNAFKALVKSATGGGGLSAEDAKKFTNSLKDASDALAEDRKNRPKDRKFWQDSEDEHEKLRRRWKEVATQYPKTVMFLTELAVAGEYIKDVYIKSINTYDKMNKAGLNVVAGLDSASTGFQGLQQLSVLTGVRFTELSETMMKFSPAINAFGAGKFAKTVGMASKGLTQFGYSSKEAAELLGEYLSIQQGMADVSGKTSEETNKDLNRFAGNINKLSLATGMSRTAILANLEAISKSTDASVLQGQTGTAAATSTLEFISSIKDQNFGRTLLKMMTDQIKPLNQTFSSFQKIGQGGFGQKLMAFTQSIKGMDPESARQAMKTFEEQNHAQIEYGKQQANFYSQIPELAGEANAALEVYTKLQQTGRETVKVSDEDLAKLKATNTARAELSSAWEKLLSSLQRAFAPTAGMLNILTAGLNFLNGAIDGLISIIPDGALALGGAFAVVAAVVSGLGLFKSGLSIVSKALLFFTNMLFGAGKKKGAKEWTTSLGADGTGGKAKGAGMLSNIGKGIGDLGKGIGAGIGGLIKNTLTGLADGLKALGDPKVLKGVVALAGMAGVLWLTGKALKEFIGLDWETLGKAAAAITGLGVAGFIFGKGAGTIAQGAVALGLMGAALWVVGKAVQTFIGIKWETLKIAAAAIIGLGIAGVALGAGIEIIALGAVALGLMGAALWVVGGAINAVGSGIETIARGFTMFGQINGKNLLDVAQGITALGGAIVAFTAGSAISAVGGIFSTLGNGISKLFGDGSVLDQIKAFASAGPGLQMTAGSLSVITSSLSTLSDVLNAFTGLNTLKSIVNTVNGIDTVKALAFGALNAMGVSLPSPTPTTGISASAGPMPSTLDSPSTVSTVVKSSEQAPVKEATIPSSSGIEKSGADSNINSALSYQSSVLDQVSQGIKDLVSVNQEILRYTKVQA